MVCQLVKIGLGNGENPHQNLRKTDTLWSEMSLESVSGAVGQSKSGCSDIACFRHMVPLSSLGSVLF